MTLEESFKTLKTAFSGKNAEVEKLTKEILSLKSDNEKLSNDLLAVADKINEISALTSERDALSAKVEELTKSLATAEKLNIESATQIESASEKAAKIVAAAGATPVELPIEASEKSGNDVWNQYLEIKDPVEKQKFYNKNRSSILKHFGLK